LETELFPEWVVQIEPVASIATEVGDVVVAEP
jgi:hypothetical protein